MKAADTSASSAMADWTPLTVVSRSSTTAEIDTFITEVSTTRTNMAAASSKDSRWLRFACLGSLVFVVSLISARPFRRFSAANPRGLVSAGPTSSDEGGRRLSRLSLSDFPTDRHAFGVDDHVGTERHASSRACLGRSLV